MGGRDGHNPIEDALAAMELVLLKLRNGLVFGDAVLGYGMNQMTWKMKNRFLQSLEKEVSLLVIRLSCLRFIRSCFVWQFDNQEKMAQDSSVAKKSKKKNDNTDENDEDESAFDLNSHIHMKTFTFLQTHNREATLITGGPTQKTIEQAYRPKLMTLAKGLVKLKRPDEPLVQPVRVLSAKDLPDVVQVFNDTRLDSCFTLIHTSLSSPEDKKDADSRKDKLKKLDRAIADIYEGISLNGMMIVIFGGSVEDETQNGACLVRIRKPHVI